MVKRLLSVVGFLLIILIACSMILNTQILFTAIQDGLQICTNAILPSLFPFFILSDFWIRSGNAARIALLIEPVTVRLFHISSKASSAFLLGIIGGYPIGAKNIAQQYEDGQISKQDAEQALLFCNNAGPAFIICVVGTSVFHNILAGVVLYIIHVFAAIITGVLFRPKRRPSEDASNKICNTKKSTISLFVESMLHGSQTTIQVCMFVLFFSIISSLFNTIFLTNAPSTISVLLLGLLELANGVNILSASALLPQTEFLIAAFLLGFGGICVLFQSLSIIYSSGLSPKNLVFGKLIHGIISTVIAYFSWIPIFGPTQNNLVDHSIFNTLLIASVGMIMVLIPFLKITSGKKPEFPI